MRQVLLTNDDVTVARMPAPAVNQGQVLIKVDYSMISVGTEIAGLKQAYLDRTKDKTSLEQAKEVTSLAKRYLAAAVANPRLAAKRITEIAQSQIGKIVPPKSVELLPDIPYDNINLVKDNAFEFDYTNGALNMLTDDSDWQYQAHCDDLLVESGYQIGIEMNGEIGDGAISLGLLNEDKSSWLANTTLEAGKYSDTIVLDPKDSGKVTIVFSNAQKGSTKVNFETFKIKMIPPNPEGLPLSEMDDTGWNLGYSAAGVVMAVGEGVNDLTPGDIVACGGATKANHADYVSVPRNLVCKVPEGCDPLAACSTTIGTIALQGVRRASPEIGEKVCVIGLGLLGQLAVQMLLANGCYVIGMDLDEKRVARAKSFGMQQGTSDPSMYAQLVRDCSYGFGADKVLICAATKSDVVVNSAMEVCRRKGKVVIVGDVGLNVERSHFYKKEIDLLMSTSYGPGRYDSSYEEAGIDYPYAYVRWTQNRNMQSYMDLIAQNKLDVASLIDVVAPVDDAKNVYKALVESGEEQPLGVVLSYPKDSLIHGEAPEAKSIRLKGHRTAIDDAVNYVLVGAGAYGQSMLVPNLEKQRDTFFLKGVVSRDAVRGGNFVREKRLEVFASDLDDILTEDKVNMLVIATRHFEHAPQVIKGLEHGKHIFVEKPLAVTWDQLNDVVTTYESLEEKPLVMVGFNRRFSPAIQKLKEVLADRRSPLMINYRLNGGYIPKDSWIQNEQGAGRNIGEACHMYDVFRCLSGSQVVDINAQSINPKDLPYMKTDNFSATLSYADGSLGTLIYSALGPKKGLPKERIEVFCDGEVYIVDDFKKLIKASTDEVLWQSADADKGQAKEMEELAKSFKNGSESPIPFEEIAETTAVALQIEDLLTGKVLRSS